MPDFTKFVDFEAIATNIVAYLPKALISAALLILFWGINRVLQRVLSKTFERIHMEKQARGLLLRLIKFVVYILAFLTIADQLGINVTSLVAGLGIMGLAVSFAAQDTINNLISGITIIIDNQFNEGDWIAVGGLDATVSQIRMRTTVLSTFDNEVVVIPNKQLAQERIINYTLTPNARVRVFIGIAYKEDTHRAREILLNTLKGDNRILPDPAPGVWVTELAASSVVLRLHFWIRDPMDKYPMMWEYNEKCKHALDDAGIEIPFPHLQLFLEQTEGVKLLAHKQGEKAI